MSEEEKEAIWYCCEILADNENDIKHWKIVEKLIKKLQKENFNYRVANKLLEDEAYKDGFEERKKLQKENEELQKEKEKLIEANYKLKSTKRVKAYKVYKENTELKEKIKEYEIGKGQE